MNGKNRKAVALVERANPAAIMPSPHLKKKAFSRAEIQNINEEHNKKTRKRSFCVVGAWSTTAGRVITRKALKNRSLFEAFFEKARLAITINRPEKANH